MKITKLETFHVKPRWHLLKITTDEGICGWGEPIVEGRARTVETAVHELEVILIGANPLHIEALWTKMYRGTFYRGGPVLTSAISGIDQALWDIKGKYYNAPVYELIGGPTRDRVRVYAHCGGATAEEFIENAKAKIEEGFTAFKTGIPGPVDPVPDNQFIENFSNYIGAICDGLPKNIQLAVDFHGKVTPAAALKLVKELEQYNLMFIEEPIQCENVDSLVTIARSTSTPSATGERIFTRWGFREILEKQAAMILQPDICHCGGISEAIKIANMAETYYALIAPHNPLGPVSLAAGLQVDASIPNFLCQEQVNLGEGYLKKPFEVIDGHIEIPKGPGLGIEVNEEFLEEQKYSGDWDTPRWSLRDGSFVEW